MMNKDRLDDLAFQASKIDPHVLAEKSRVPVARVRRFVKDPLRVSMVELTRISEAVKELSA